MPGAIDPSLRQAIASLSQTDLLVGGRLIAPGDDSALLPAEAETITTRVAEARRASGAARIVARELMTRLGVAAAPIPKHSSGSPLWPKGLVGSFAHDATIAVAAVGRSRAATAVGIDIEPAAPLPSDLHTLVLTPDEQTRIADDAFGGRLVFAVKEAVYKAVYPLDRTFLEFQDIAVDLRGGEATVRNGRKVRFRSITSTHLVVLALAD